jgi:hypothetical protein
LIARSYLGEQSACPTPVALANGNVNEATQAKSARLSTHFGFELGPRRQDHYEALRRSNRASSSPRRGLEARPCRPRLTPRGDRVIEEPCRNRSGLIVLRFLGRLDEDVIHARQQEASEKRQGTKSREVWHPTVQERLWGIRHVDCGVDLGRETLGGAISGRWECEAGRDQLEEGGKHGGSGGWETRSGKRCRCRRMTRREGGLLCAMQL